jgi:hypothetical protein
MVNTAFEKVQLKMVFILSYLGLKLNPHVFFKLKTLFKSIKFPIDFNILLKVLDNLDHNFTKKNLN